MYARTYGAATMGVEGLLIDVEVDAANGLPGFEMVGMPDTLVREAKERVRTAIRNSGIMMHQERVTVNLAPAAIRKESAGLDLPIAIALLAADGIIGSESIGNYAFIGELSLEGGVVQCGAFCLWLSRLWIWGLRECLFPGRMYRRPCWLRGLLFMG